MLHVDDKIKQLIYRPALGLLPKKLFQLQHLRMHRRFGAHWYWANLDRPRTFNEKLLRSKLSGEHRKYGYLVDKELVKAWVRQRIGPAYVIETYDVLSQPNPSKLANLPLPCILKPTHSSGRVLLLEESEDASSPKTHSTVSKWLKLNHYYLSGEPQYRDLKPKVICERLLSQSGQTINDYKVFCFHGKPYLIQVDVNRFSGHRRVFYDLDWRKRSITLRYPLAEGSQPIPENLDRMLEFAEKLSVGFSFVRVDFYDHRGELFFGEMTFHPESGLAPFSTYGEDLSLGRILEGA